LISNSLRKPFAPRLQIGKTGPLQTLVVIAANFCKEPSMTDAASYMNVCFLQARRQEAKWNYLVCGVSTQ